MSQTDDPRIDVVEHVVGDDGDSCANDRVSSEPACFVAVHLGNILMNK